MLRAINELQWLSEIQEPGICIQILIFVLISAVVSTALSVQTKQSTFIRFGMLKYVEFYVISNRTKIRKKSVELLKEK